MGIEQEAFKDRNHVLAEIKKCGMAAAITSYLAILFAVIGVVADLVDEAIGLEALNWLLLAIVAAVLTVPPEIHLVMAKHLLGTEIIRK